MRERNGQREVENLKILKALLCSTCLQAPSPLISPRRAVSGTAALGVLILSTHTVCIRAVNSSPAIPWLFDPQKASHGCGVDLHQRCAHISPRWTCLQQRCGWRSAERAQAVSRQQWEERGWNGSVGQGWRNVLCCMQG